MIRSLQNKYRDLHISRNWIRLGRIYRYHKPSGRLLSVKNRVPNLVILGAQKCGTTSLFHYLNKHSDICGFFPLKEPGYFIFDEFAQRYFKQYKNILIGDKSELVSRYMVGNLTDENYFLDASTYYTQDENEIRYDIPYRIYNESPDCRFIYLIRNPFQRMISAFYHQKRAGAFSSFIEGVNNSWNINISLYFNRIKSYKELFGKEKILILNMEDLAFDPETVLNEVYSFLNLNKTESLDYSIHNKTSPERVNSKFDVETYDRLHSLFLEQKEALKNEYGIAANWDLSEKTWLQD